MLMLNDRTNNIYNKKVKFVQKPTISISYPIGSMESMWRKTENNQKNKSNDNRT